MDLDANSVTGIDLREALNAGLAAGAMHILTVERPQTTWTVSATL
jgi:hypothetical protein